MEFLHHKGFTKKAVFVAHSSRSWRSGVCFYHLYYVCYPMWLNDAPWNMCKFNSFGRMLLKKKNKSQGSLMLDFVPPESIQPLQSNLLRVG